MEFGGRTSRQHQALEVVKTTRCGTNIYWSTEAHERRSEGLSANRDALTSRGRAHAEFPFLRLPVFDRARVSARLRLICVSPLLQETALLGGTATLETHRAGMATDATGDLMALGARATSIVTGSCGVVRSRGGCGQMGNVFRNRMAGADVGHTDIRGFAGFAEGIITGIKIFAFLGR